MANNHLLLSIFISVLVIVAFCAFLQPVGQNISTEHSACLFKLAPINLISSKNQFLLFGIIGLLFLLVTNLYFYQEKLKNKIFKLLPAKQSREKELISKLFNPLRNLLSQGIMHSRLYNLA